MSDATITNFIEPTKSVVEWAMTQLDTVSGLNVYKYHKLNYEELFFYLLDWKSPCAVVIYAGSIYTDNIQRRQGSLSVIVADKDMVDASGSVDRSQDLLDDAISKLDHMIYNNLLCRVVSDKPIYFKNAGMTAYEAGFRFDDH